MVRKYFNFLNIGDNEVMIEDTIKRYERKIERNKEQIHNMEAKILFLKRERFFILDKKQKTLGV